MEVYRGSFVYQYYSETRFRSLGAGISAYRDEWGSSGGTTNNFSIEPLPQELSVIYFSLAEVKFYGDNFPLPQEKLANLFEKGFKTAAIKNKQLYIREREYNYLTVGLAPGGLVVVWAGGGGYQKEVAHFQAKEIGGITMKDYKPFRDEDILTQYAKNTLSSNTPYVIDHLSQHGVESDLFKRYMERFNTRFLFNFEDKTGNPGVSDFNISSTNGESLPFIAQEQEFSNYGEYARVKYLSMTWKYTDKYGHPIFVDLRIWIKKEEFLRLYEQAWGTDHNKPVDFVFNIGKHNEIALFLIDGTHQYLPNMDFVQVLVQECFDKKEVLYQSSNYVFGKKNWECWDDYSD